MKICSLHTVLYASFLFFNGAAVNALELFGCIPRSGYCSSGSYLDEVNTEDVDQCDWFCEQSSECNFYSFFPTNGLCLLYGECYELAYTSDSGELSAYSRCQCMSMGECDGNVVQVAFLPDLHECVEACNSEVGCTWWNYDPSQSLCQMMSNCTSIDASTCPECSTGEKNCYQQEYEDKRVLFVTSGSNTQAEYDPSVEVIPLSSDYLRCPAVPDAPFASFYGLGFVHDSSLVVCAMGNTKNCYRFNTNLFQWEDFGKTIEVRAYAAGVQNGDSFIAMGGQPTSISFTQTTEVFLPEEEAFALGEKLPYEISQQCVALVDDSSSQVILSGGFNYSFSNGIRDEMGIFNLNDGTWTELPRLSAYRHIHGCGMVYPFGEDPYFVVVGGRTYITSDYEYINTAESLRIGDTDWQPVPSIPLTSLAGAASVPYENTFLLVGGSMDEDVTPSPYIWQYDVNNPGSPWIQRTEQLSMARADGPVAILTTPEVLKCRLETSV